MGKRILRMLYIFTRFAIEFNNPFQPQSRFDLESVLIRGEVWKVSIL